MWLPSPPVKLYVYLLHQDDPGKCTSSKLVRFNWATPVSRSRIPPRAIILNPYGEHTLTPGDKALAKRFGIVSVDCSWEIAENEFKRRIRGVHRRLPSLLPGNPVSYGIISRLSSLEAFAAALYIISWADWAERLLRLYKWGKTFLTLNADLLEAYRLCTSEEEVSRTESEFFG
ncbi:MAG: DUF367 family protein [Candidatus Bathyarchaeia archaeon]